MVHLGEEKEVFNVYDFSDLTIGSYKGFIPHGCKATLLHKALRHSQCMQSLKGVAVKDSDRLASHAFRHICTLSPGTSFWGPFYWGSCPSNSSRFSHPDKARHFSPLWLSTSTFTILAFPLFLPLGSRSRKWLEPLVWCCVGSDTVPTPVLIQLTPAWHCCMDKNNTLQEPALFCCWASLANAIAVSD